MGQQNLLQRMKYVFDKITPRRATNSYKWDTAHDDDVLPMWVADMDFRTAPAVVEALRKRVEHGIFGYTKVPPAYYEAITDWFARRHGWQIEKTGLFILRASYRHCQPLSRHSPFRETAFWYNPRFIIVFSLPSAIMVAK